MTHIITARKVSEGYVFTRVCLSRGACVAGGGCMAVGMRGGGVCVAGGHAWQGGVCCRGGM